MRKSQIPEYLRDLRTDPETGRPVPFIQAWADASGKPDINRFSIGYDKACRGIGAYYLDDPANDVRADWHHVAPQRQRASMVYGLCQVCERPLDWGIRALPVSKASVEEIDLHATKAMAVFEPWLCPDCAYFAAKWCPALVTRKQSLDLVFVPVHGPEECQLVMSSGWIEGPYERKTKEEPVYIAAKVILFEGEQKLRGVLAQPVAVRDRSDDFTVVTDDSELTRRLPPDLRIDGA